MKIRKYALTGAMAFALVSPSLAQTYRDSSGTVVPGVVLLGGCPTGGGSCTGPGGIGPVVTIAPYAYTPLTPGQHNLSIVTSTGLTVPTGSTYATVCAATANVKYTTDGTTTPTSSVGMMLSTGSCVSLSGATVLANFRAISATGTLDVEYYK